MTGNTKGLGRGLSALMGDDYSPHVSTQIAQPEESQGAISELPTNALTSGQFQPRQYFDDHYLNELADSIKSNGVMQPILVRSLKTKRNGASYEIIAGERRWRASKLAGLQKIPVILKELEDNKALEVALIENIQRQDLNALEEAEGYQQLIDRFGYTQETLAKVVGKSRSYVANALRLLGLPDSIKTFLNEGKISAGHARTLLSSDEKELIAKKIVSEGLNVRQVEQLVKHGIEAVENHNGHEGKKNGGAKERNVSLAVSDANKDPDILALEETLTDHLGLQVVINDKQGQGAMMLHYKSLSELDSLLQRLGGTV